ncbi:MAG: hypothetical protein IJH12_01780 [Clostridia bacterium]|nr:hypothetical protein [Clostridia bacterium]
MDNFLLLAVAGILIVVAILAAVLVFMTMKEKSQKSNASGAKKVDDELETARAKKSMFKFMEFDGVEDNMIVQDGGKRYLMVLECKGVNYDLLSEVEKNGVEQGFISFLNALKFEVQLYIQTRKVNLAQSTMRYRERLKIIEMDMREEEQKYQNLLRNPNATRDEIVKGQKEVAKKKNLYEYSRDIIENTEQMSEDADLTTKEYYIVVPYYTDEITSAGDYDKREIGSMAFSELYTRAQSLVSALTECDVRGRILNSKELIELLFISYNREQHDTYDFDEYIDNSGYDSFYSVAPDVLEKRMKALDDEIERKAKDKAIEAYRRVNRRTELRIQAIRDREENMKEYINQLAEEALDSQASVMGKSKAEESKKELEVMDKELEEKRAARKAKMERANGENNNNNADEEAARAERAKRINNLSREEKIKLAQRLKKKRMLKEMEAKKNGEN